MTASVAVPRLGLATKVSYGLGSVAQGVGSVALSTAVINFYLISVVGLRPAIVGLVILTSLVIDAVLDPLIGRWSDMTRTRWGRRHPFMYASALPIALATCFLWRHPAGLSGASLAVYVLAMLITLRLAGGLYQIPSDALAPELAPDYHERTGLISWRWFFGVFGAIAVGVLLNAVFLRKDAANPLGQYSAAGYANFGLAAGGLAFVCIIASAMATQRYIPTLARPPSRRMTLGETLREVGAVLSNASLLAIIASGFFSGIAGGITESLRNFMNFDFWGMTPQVVAAVGAMAAPGTLVGIIAAPALSRALDKKRTMMTVFVLAIFTGVIPVLLRLLDVLPPNGSPLIPVILGADLFVATTLGIAGFVIVGSMIADVVEDSAVKTGVRSEGLLFAANGLLPKITTGVGAVTGNLMLELVRFPAVAVTNPATVVDPAIMRHLALISLPAGAILNLVAVSVLVFYRIDRGSHEANLEALRLAASVTEPPTALPAGGGPTLETGSVTPPL